MAGEVTGTLCLIKGGTYATPTELYGQGTMGIENTGDLIPIDNKSSGEWAVYIDGASTTKGQVITVEFDYNDSAEFKTLLAAARNKTAGPYVIDMLGYYYEGTYVPSMPSESANKNEGLKMTIIFSSSGPVTSNDAPAP